MVFCGGFGGGGGGLGVWGGGVGLKTLGGGGDEPQNPELSVRAWRSADGCYSSPKKKRSKAFVGTR